MLPLYLDGRKDSPSHTRSVRRCRRRMMRSIARGRPCRFMVIGRRVFGDGVEIRPAWWVYIPSLPVRS